MPEIVSPSFPLIDIHILVFTYVDQAMVGDLPAGLEPQHVQGPRLLGGEVREGGVGHVIGLQPIRAQHKS